MDTRATRAAVVILAAALVMSGCATVRPGTALRDPNIDPGAVNTALLDPGRYPTKPRAPLGTAGDEASGKLVEARRMAEAVVLPFEADGALLTPQPISGPLRGPQGLNTTFYYGISSGLSAFNFVSGVISAASAQGSYGTNMSNVVLRFATPEDAAAAAAEMGKRALQPDGVVDREAMREIPTPERPGTVLVESTDRAFTDVYAFTAQGPYVLAQAATAPEAADATRRVLAALDKQRPALEKFTPTPADQLKSLPVDPPGLLARTLPAAPNSVNAERLGLFGPHGALLFMDNPLRDQQLFTAGGLEWMAKSAANVYQLRDAKAASTLAEAWTKSIAEQKYSRAAGVPGMPTSRCQLSPESKYSSAPRSYYCLMTADKYLIEVISADETDAHQKVAAQYMMLTSE